MVDDQDIAFKCWLEQVLTEDMRPSDHFFATQDSSLFDTSLHHVMPHHQQDRLGMPTTAFSADATSAAFFQLPAQQMANVTGAGMATSTTAHHYRQDSPSSTHSGGSSSKRRGTARSTDGDDLDGGSDEAQAAIKRQRNTMAARKYRQKRLDRIADLERALSEMTGERDDLKLKLARREAEVEALREMLGRK
ncbi:gaf domain nucleotide-binding [Trichoderma cornu-damae]|uniref:Gaf domain nucleotide-binding n=1 Tax=Trichoderma cornu-damae TaxID=654480 RepID=A0A9P8TY20_9HYPO|nr:gaf domain nucleotide-binding [Trichoderma cornu-damae]